MTACPTCDPLDPVPITVSAGEITLDDARRVLVEATIRATRGNLKRASRILGISRRTLYNWLPRPYRRAA